MPEQAKLLAAIALDEPEKIQEILRKDVEVQESWSVSMGYSSLHLACFH